MLFQCWRSLAGIKGRSWEGGTGLSQKTQPPWAVPCAPLQQPRSGMKDALREALLGLSGSAATISRTDSNRLHNFRSHFLSVDFAFCPTKWQGWMTPSQKFLCSQHPWLVSRCVGEWGSWKGFSSMCALGVSQWAYKPCGSLSGDVPLVWLLSRVWLFCDPMDCSPPGSSVQRISQPGILEWVVPSFSRVSLLKRHIMQSCIQN